MFCIIAGVDLMFLSLLDLFMPRSSLDVLDTLRKTQREDDDEELVEQRL